MTKYDAELCFLVGVSDYAEIVEDEGDYSTPGSTYHFYHTESVNYR